MDINCDKIVEKYLLIQNPLYTFSFPVSVLVAIIIFGVSKAYNWSNNSYIIQIVIPILSLLFTMVILDLISRIMINKDDKIKLSNLCKIWLHDPNNKKNSNNLNINKIANYSVENFTNPNSSIPNTTKQNTSIKVPIHINKPIINQVEPLLDTIPNVMPYPLDAKPDGKMCIVESNICTLCSGTNQNPDNIIAPVPGPQWLPLSAEAMQNRLMNNQYTPSVCPIK